MRVPTIVPKWSSSVIRQVKHKITLKVDARGRQNNVTTSINNPLNNPKIYTSTSLQHGLGDSRVRHQVASSAHSLYSARSASFVGSRQSFRLFAAGAADISITHSRRHFMYRSTLPLWSAQTIFSHKSFEPAFPNENDRTPETVNKTRSALKVNSLIFLNVGYGTSR